MEEKKPLLGFTERLRSYESRLALDALVLAQLLPPPELPRLYGRQKEEAQEALRKCVAAIQGKRSPEFRQMEAATWEATQAHLEWTGKGLSSFFLARAQVMIEWVKRLNLTGSTEEWSPDKWVRSARELEAEPSLFSLVMEKAPATTWAAWREAMDFESDWDLKWIAWTQSFERTPTLALRWIDDLLSSKTKKPSVLAALEPKGSSRIDLGTRLLSAYRIRLWQHLLRCQEEGRPSLLLQEVDAKLERLGIPRNLSAANWVTVFYDTKGKLLTTRKATRNLQSLLVSIPSESRKWLEQTTPLYLGVLGWGEKQRDAHARTALDLMGHHGACGSSDLRAWLTQLDITRPGVREKTWEDLLGAPLYRVLGTDFPSQKKEPTATTLSPKKKKTKSKPAPKKKKEKLLLEINDVEIPRFQPR